ncbi:MAG: hypothetical protein ACLQVD_21650, partial [Capsulimonadaceae bacterium]
TAALVTLGANTALQENFTFPALHSFAGPSTTNSGIYMFSMPYDYSGVSWSTPGLFGSSYTGTVATWLSASQTWDTSPTYPADSAHLGYAYWIKLVSGVDVTLQGAAPTGPSVSVALYPVEPNVQYSGWNMIGVPSTTPINLTSLTFQNPNGGAPISWAAATTTAGLVYPILFGYDPTVNNGPGVPPGNYVQVGTTLSQTQIEPYQGYWIYAYEPATIIIPTTGP